MRHGIAAVGACLTEAPLVGAIGTTAFGAWLFHIRVRFISRSDQCALVAASALETAPAASRRRL
jgi:hypothetical protein